MIEWWVSLLPDASVAAVDEEHQQNNETVEDLLPSRLDADNLQHVLEQDHGDRPSDGPGVVIPIGARRAVRS